jgi:hypothetical protein
MNQTPDPQMGAFFKVNQWNKNSVEQLKTELLKAIAEDPEISNASNIGLDLEAGIAKVERVRLVGSVGSEAERQRARRIVEVNTREELEVENELAVNE